MTRRLFLIAGEPSGDRLGAALMAGLKAMEPDLEFHGIGGPLMQAEGLQTLFPMEELSVIGLAEILPHLRSLLRRVSETADEIVATRPDALITIDIPEFSLRVAAKVKARARDLRTIHYVAPTVWAWRAGRAKKMARSIDHVLALFPFEPPLMEAAGMTCDFVGHPVTTEPVASAEEAQAFRSRQGIGADAPLLLVLPGSRRGEVARLSPIFGEALRPVLAAHPDLRVVLPTLAAVADDVAELTASWPVPPVILDPRERSAADAAAEKRAAFAAADLALAASGTVSLELAAAATPMVIAYDMSWLSKQVIRMMLRIDTVTLVNLVSDSHTVPEFLAENCRPGPISDALLQLLEDGAARQAQLDAADLAMDRLGRGGDAPGLRAAASVLRAI
ncbi:lipid-A-disaccharide synthase [Roseobacter sp. HKCCD9010]|uniref:lipid-A-disaccharide synthase n=1 Tax=unclassified Roseobacter TaxID=196798 RepID=UPI0014915E58|nr:lipid-A-disaccharide synthase [Rhodobacterales bacterium HKCCD4356]NNV12040.1 lipid-A-disaccharide synthase [Roseobacter sp. HKCCD7357]NNV17054.1 lipid-A-disaccharide synthase [Roseobacter sp. HKCCD8768]NNV26283.1 lipid-A-disaccharide synthase [Roseobacter sp. HKCCD8192]NNV30778.1 lipid-A-disaccharide synthase [Roseobacter sp. HKCCD9061]NNV35042.1 lipid-A-disaccharide synthase [Roseobacter sp. HKCCD9073]NNV39061.1 lipid-A-disaccharide synthase [Roseobacter sp. HKCCD9054]NNV43577.1 lipid-A